MPHLLAFAGTLKRQGSVNKQLIALAADLARRQGATVELCDLDRFEMPLYRAEEEAAGFPAGAEEMRRQLEAAQGVLLASPEYNFSIPGALKNALDWTSRYRPSPWRDHHAMLLSASPSAAGGSRGLMQLQIPLTVMGVHLYPHTFSLPRANKAWDEDGQLHDGKLQQRLEQTLSGFIKMLDAMG